MSVSTQPNHGMENITKPNRTLRSDELVLRLPEWRLVFKVGKQTCLCVVRSCKKCFRFYFRTNLDLFSNIITGNILHVLFLFQHATIKKFLEKKYFL